ncbi:MAG: hypothetical protein FJW31_26115, partial [Acidobacteria bacterium]|nr:hypothetical protein [Acidobacteriota bacterium]
MRSGWRGAALAVVAWAVAQPQSRGIVEASGVTRVGDALLVVDDSDIGAYFRVPLPKAPPPLLDLNALRPNRVELKNRGLGVDLESIGMLADGRVVALSERLRLLVSNSGIVAEYDSGLWCKIWVDTGLIPFRSAGLDRTRLRSRCQRGSPDLRHRRPCP